MSARSRGRLAVLVALSLGLGCAPAPHAPEALPERASAAMPMVELAPPAVAAVTASGPEPAAPSTCRIAGAGELASYDGVQAPRFELFAGPAGGRPRAVVRYPSVVPAVWSELPPVTALELRARVAIDGQKLVRIAAHASLAGRAFQLLRRAEVVPGTLWLRRGARVELRGVDGPELHVALLAPAPNDLRAVTDCAGVGYEPKRVESARSDAPPSTEGSLRPTGERLSLHASPDGPRIAELHLGAQGTLGALERRAGWVRVAGGDRELAFDAWAPAAEVAPYEPGDLTLSGSGSGSTTTSHTVPVPRDLPLSVGSAPPGDPLGVLLAGARVAVLARDAGYARIVLEGREIEPGDGLSFFVREVDLAAEAPSIHFEF
ncbi:MAG: hypothetical protein HY908_07950 [Myxococcales bacterium]|nr:hypothetical protein [Myxococcales bacterium]